MENTVLLRLDEREIRTILDALVQKTYDLQLLNDALSDNLKELNEQLKDKEEDF